MLDDLKATQLSKDGKRLDVQTYNFSVENIMFRLNIFWLVI